MKITVHQSSLDEALKKCKSALPRSAALPELNAALVSVTEAGLSITVTNLEQRITARVMPSVALIVHEVGESCVPYIRLCEIVEKMRGTIDLSVSDTFAANLTGKAGSKEVTGTLHGFASNNYPKPGPELKVACEFLDVECKIAGAIKKVSGAAQKDDVRMYMAGIHIGTHEGKIRLEASDGRRAHAFSTDFEQEIDILVPTVAANAIESLFGDDTENEPAKFKVYENRLRLETDVLTFETKLIEYKFPNIQPLIPENINDSIIIQREDVLHALDVLSAIKDTGTLIQSDLLGVTFAARDASISDILISIAASQSKNCIVYCNRDYLREAIKSTQGDTIKIQMGGDKNSIFIRDGDFFAVIAPLAPPK